MAKKFMTIKQNVMLDIRNLNESIEKQYDQVKADLAYVEADIEKKMASMYEQKYYALIGLRYIRDRGLYHQDPQFRKKSIPFESYLLYRWGERHYKFQLQLAALFNYPKETVTYGIENVTRIISRNRDKTDHILQALEKKQDSLKTRMQQPQIDAVIKSFEEQPGKSIVNSNISPVSRELSNTDYKSLYEEELKKHQEDYKRYMQDKKQLLEQIERLKKTARLYNKLRESLSQVMTVPKSSGNHTGAI
jgi:hypothetical protein